MDWMYKGDKDVNTDDFLLGKKVDASSLEAISSSSTQDGSSVVTVDIANKIREDPLFAIKQKEANRRKALMDNPIKLKQLQKMLQSQVGKEAGGKKKKKEKHKHKHKKAKRVSSESEDDSDSDEDLDAKLMEKLRGQGLRSKEEVMKNVLKKEKSYGLVNKSRRPPDPKGKDNSRRRSSSPDERSRHRKSEARVKGDRDGSKHRGHLSQGHSRRERSRSRSPRRRPRDNDRRRSPEFHREDRRPRKMDAGEMERKRQEMMDNAKWRDEQRESRVKKYKAVDAKEEEAEGKKSSKAEFFNPLKLSSNSTVEDRIKRNIYNIQRTNAALDKNFAKR